MKNIARAALLVALLFVSASAQDADGQSAPNQEKTGVPGAFESYEQMQIWLVTNPTGAGVVLTHPTAKIVLPGLPSTDDVVRAMKVRAKFTRKSTRTFNPENGYNYHHDDEKRNNENVVFARWESPPGDSPRFVAETWVYHEDLKSVLDIFVNFLLPDEMREADGTKVSVTLSHFSTGTKKEFSGSHAAVGYFIKAFQAEVDPGNKKASMRKKRDIANFPELGE